VGSSTISWPASVTEPITVSTDGIQYTVNPGHLTVWTSRVGPTSSGPAPSSSPSSGSENIGTPSATGIVIDGSTYALGPQTSTVIADGTTYILEPGAVVVGSHTITLPIGQTAPTVISTDGIVITENPDLPASKYTSATEVIIGSGTFTLGTQNYTFVDDGTTLILGTGGIVFGTKTISYPATQTGPFVFSTDGLTLTIEPAPSPTLGSPSPTSSSGATEGSSPTQSLPTSTAAPTKFVETITASDGQSTIEVTFQATTLSQFSTLTGLTTIGTTEDGTLTSIVVGSGGVVWGCTDCSSHSGFPSISYPSVPPIVPSKSSSQSSFPFPSSQFTLPPIITTVITTSGPGGVFVTTETGTRNSNSAIVPVVTLQSAGATLSANALATGIQGLATIVNSFSANPSNTQAASSALAAVKNTESGKSAFHQLTKLTNVHSKIQTSLAEI
jgi:hypothetical protein